MTLALVPGQPGDLGPGDVVDVDVSVVLGHGHHPRGADADLVDLQHK